MFDDLLPEIKKGIANSTGSIPVVFKGIERQFAKEDLPSKSNQHEFHELLFVRSGKAQFEIAGRKIYVEKGDTLVIRPFQPHKIIVNDGKIDMIVLYFGFRKFNSLTMSENTINSEDIPFEVTKFSIESFLQFASGSNATQMQTEKVDPYLTIKGKIRQDIASIVDRILRESRSDAYGKELMMQFLTMELLVALSRGLREEWEDSIRVKTGKAKELVKMAREFLVEHHDRDISVTDAASYVFLSQGYFTRAFRDEIGMSPMSFLMQIRVDHACRLLEQKEIKVGGIARQVGFASPQRFNAAFRKQMGITPMEYRKQILDKNG